MAKYEYLNDITVKNCHSDLQMSEITSKYMTQEEKEEVKGH